MSQHVSIRSATQGDFPVLPALELDAARAFAVLGWDEIAAMPPITEDEYLHNSAQQHVLVAEFSDSAGIIGFCVLCELDQQAFIMEFGVGQSFTRRGIGRQLLAGAICWAQRSGYSDLLLTTFADAPFNAPFYRRYGFETVQPGDDFPQLARKLKSEREGILGNYVRLAMRYRLSAAD
jgi:GNAT superfamily N-acetyltransferase